MPQAVYLRLFGVFGMHEDWQTRFISNAICRAIHDLPVSIIQDVCFDFLYVEDLARIVEWFVLNNPKQKDYNVCSGDPHLLSDLARMVMKSVGKKLPLEIVRNGYGREYSGSNRRLVGEMPDLHFTPTQTAIDGLAKWYKDHLDKIPYCTIAENKRVALERGTSK
jgi:GDP-L-fucose synthase